MYARLHSDTSDLRSRWKLASLKEFSNPFESSPPPFQHSIAERCALRNTQVVRYRNSTPIILSYWFSPCIGCRKSNWKLTRFKVV